jgi:hypothetical protein
MPALGRWTTTDPILGEKGPKKLLKKNVRYLSETPYVYTHNNPTNLIDPDGKQVRPETKRKMDQLPSINEMRRRRAIQGMRQAMRQQGTGRRSPSASFDASPATGASSLVASSIFKRDAICQFRPVV